MSQIRVILLATLLGLALFGSLCLFTVAPYEHVIVERFGQQIEPVQIFGESAEYTVLDVANDNLVFEMDGQMLALRPMSRLTEEEYTAAVAYFRGKTRGGEGELPFIAQRTPLGPGLYLKWPTPINRVRRFSARLNVFKDALSEIQTASAEPIMIQPYMLWQVVDPVKYWTSVGGDERRIDEIIENRLKSVLSALVSRNYRIEDFYSLDVVKSRELRAMEEKRLISVFASPEIARTIDAEVQEFRAKALLSGGRMGLQRYRRLADLTTRAKTPVDLPELAEMSFLDTRHMIQWRESRLMTNQTPERLREISEGLLNENARRDAYLLDRLARERKMGENAGAALREFAVKVAAEDLLVEGFVQLLSEARATFESVSAKQADTVLDDSKVWQGYYASPRVAQARQRATRLLEQAELFLVQTYNFKEAALKEIRQGALVTALGMVSAELAERQLNAEQAVAQAARTREAARQAAEQAAAASQSAASQSGRGSPASRQAALQAAAQNAQAAQAAAAAANSALAVSYSPDQLARLGRLQVKLAEAIAAELGLDKPAGETIDAEALFMTLVETHVRFLSREAEIQERMRSATSSDERRSVALELDGLARSRQERENRLVGLLKAGSSAIPEEEILQAARTWAVARVKSTREAEELRGQLEARRGYPRETVEAIRASIRRLEEELATASLGANNTVKIAEMEARVRDTLNGEMLEQFGVAVREIGFRRLSFPPTVATAVYQRMSTERIRVAETIRAMGELDRSRILTDAERRKKDLIAEAEADATKLRGAGTAAAAKIIADVVDGQDAELYRLITTLNTLEQMLNKPTTTLVLQADKDSLFRPLYSNRPPTPQELGQLAPAVRAVAERVEKTQAGKPDAEKSGQ